MKLKENISVLLSKIVSLYFLAMTENGKSKENEKPLLRTWLASLELPKTTCEASSPVITKIAGILIPK